MKGLKIISSHFREDVSWLDDSGFPYLVVSKGEKVPQVRNFVTIPNRGSEFGSYVWYILNDWECLPDRVAFIHGHSDAYHQQRTILEAIMLHENSEFAGLNGDLSVAMHRFDTRHPWLGDRFSEMWNFMGLDSVRPAPSVAATQPGTQFVVSREFLKARGRNFWANIFRALMDHEGHYYLGIVLEVAWPMIFGGHPEDNPYVVDEFRYFFDREDLSVLIAHPKEAWHSGMKNTAIFDVPASKDAWISLCMEIFKNSLKSIDPSHDIDYN